MCAFSGQETSSFHLETLPWVLEPFTSSWWGKERALEDHGEFCYGFLWVSPGKWHTSFLPTFRMKSIIPIEMQGELGNVVLYWATSHQCRIHTGAHIFGEQLDILLWFSSPNIPSFLVVIVNGIFFLLAHGNTVGSLRGMFIPQM